jgi:antitoxin component YwqK of YwqJK toxin-antitoxin module
MKIGCLIVILLLSCNEQHPEVHVQQASQQIIIPAKTVLSADTALHFNNGYWYYHSSLFSGTIQTWYAPQQIKSIQTFFNGKEEGWLQTFYPDGLHESKRYYHSGEKDSLHLGWWPDGNQRFEIHFSNGAYDGMYKEWYIDGKPSKEIIYKNGNDISGKAWRNNGKLYMNFFTREGRRYGLLNSQMCYSLKNEKGEFIRSTSDTLK